MSNQIIYIPTMTSALRHEVKKLPENILYSPNSKLEKVYKAEKITIWDNYTYYLRNKYNKKDKQTVSKNHYLWLINFIKNNYQEGITLITPDIEWLNDKDEIMEKWYKTCKDYPQLYVPETWDNTDGLNIIGYALRPNSTFIHENWNHCLRHKRDISCNILTYDSVSEIL